MALTNQINYFKPRKKFKGKFRKYKFGKFRRYNNFKKQKRRIHWRLRLIMRKKNPDKKRYYAFFLKRKNNVFITITDVIGRVVISQSAGSCKITTKKKKRSWDTLKTVAESVSKLVRSKNIRYIYKLFMTNTYLKNAKIIFRAFKKSGVLVLQNVIFKSKPHALPMRKKKMKRL